ncbi:hypothetical protein Tco_1524193 [Tanacetum coccineum]
MWDGVGEQPYMLNARDIVAEKDSFVNPDGDQCSHDLQDVPMQPHARLFVAMTYASKRFGHKPREKASYSTMSSFSMCLSYM